MPPDHPTQPTYLNLLQTKPHGASVTFVLIAINVIIFLLMLKFGAGLWHSPNGVQLAWGANFGPATKDGEWWRLGTAMFLHFGLLHISMNMLALWDSGRLVERMYGHSRFILLYLLSGLFGNLLSLAVQGDHAVSGGASGAIFGVYGSLIVFLWRHRSTVHPTEFRWLFGGAVLFSLLTLGLGFSITGIDNAAHTGGLLSGALLGLMLEPHPGKVNAKTRKIQWLSFLCLIIAVAVTLLRMPSASYQWSEEQQAKVEINKLIGVDADISHRWEQRLHQAQSDGTSFDELAGKIEQEVAIPYEKSFEQLAAIQLDKDAPSATSLENIRHYIEIRRDASKSLVAGLRTKNLEQIESSLQQARSAAKNVKQQAEQKHEGAGK